MFSSLSKYSERIAVINDMDLEVKYSDLIQFSSRIQNLIPKRSVVFCLCTNNIESISGYISFLNNKVVPFLLDTALDQDLLKNLRDIYSPDFVWGPSRHVKSLFIGEEIFKFGEYTLMRLSVDIQNDIHEDLALLLTTSGSTGSPKFVRISYQNVLANAQSIAEYLLIDEHERPVTSLPMHYSFGLSIINSHLIKGATVLLTSYSLFEKSFWQFAKKYHVTSLSGVPYTYEILKKLRFFTMHIPSLKTLTQAGGKLNNELNLEFAQFAHNSKRKFFVMYGQTEATARMSYLPPEYAIPKLGSMGIAIPGGKFHLADENGQTIKENEVVGELVYDGPNVSMGYAECRNDLQKQDENLGRLYTGDLAKRDQDGFYYIVGRKKRFIKLFGNRINLDETERLIKSIISDCACTGKDDKMVVFITDSGKTGTVRDFIANKTGIHPSAFSVRSIQSIPKNSSGKTIYSNLPVENES